MSNFKSSSILLLGILFFSFYSCEKEKIINENKLPSAINTYVKTHFATCKITKIVKGKENNKLSYDLDLDCGVNIEFNDNNQVIDIDGISQLPDSTIPNNILSYISANYPNNFIIGWELEGNNQRVDLNTNIVLEFDSNGSFLRIIS